MERELIEQISAAAFGVFGPRRRRWNRSAQRLHVETRIASRDEGVALQERLEPLARGCEGVVSVQVSPVLGRAVFEFEPTRLPSVQEVLSLLERAEHECGWESRPFRNDLPEHPADLEPIVRLAAELGADLTGFWIAVAGKLVSAPILAFEIDALALVSAFEGMPTLRRFADERLGRYASSLWLGIATALAQGFVQNPLAPLVDVAYRSLQGVERLSRRTAWLEHEPELCGAAQSLAMELTELEPRPVAIPQGPIEKYVDLALAGSLGAFGLGFAATGSLADSSAGLLAGVPRPARLGREAFAALVTRSLSGRRILTLDPKALRRLELVDCLVLPESLRAEPEAESLVVEARSAGIALETLEDGEGLVEEIRERQRAGRVVLAIAAGDARGLGAADVGVSVLRGGQTAWDAHLLAGPSLADVALLIRACRAARDVAEQSVLLAEVGVGVGALAAFGQRLQWTTTSRVMTTLHLATLFSMANGARQAIGVALAPTPVVRISVPWHALTPAEALENLGSTPEGLAVEQVQERRIETAPERSRLGRLAGAFAEELANPLNPILAVGATISAAIGAVVDAGLIGAVVATDAAIGAVQRLRAQSSIDELRHERPRTVRVRREGREQIVPATALVPGDVLRLEAGDFVPADCRIVSAKDLEVDESSLTGESLPVAKSAAAVAAESEVADRSSILFEGTAIAAGRATAVVFAVGAATEASSGSGTAEPPRTGVEARLETLVAGVTPVALAGSIVTSLTGLLRGRALSDVLSTSVSLAVAAVPEGLPMVATLAQVSAARRLSSRRVLVRNPRAIEALGRATVVCLDKTGTITEGRIALRAVWDLEHEAAVDALGAAGRAVLRAALRATPQPKSGERLPHGTDRALVAGAERCGIDRGAWSRQAELPFESERGFHATLGSSGDRLLLCVKGAPESVLPRCDRIGTIGSSDSLDDAARSRVEHAAREMARRGLRVLAVAEAPVATNGAMNDERVRELVFRGLLGLADPLRPTAAEAVSGLRRAGVRLVMLTGDHPTTAESIGAALGLLDGAVLTGSAIDALDDVELAARAATTSVFARVAPRHKARLVRAFQAAGMVVAMTGDGANDAPAIRLADVGIALGTRCTTAARQAADVVVTDDHIETLVDAVLEGRALWVSVRDAVAFLVGSNVGELAFTVLGDLVSGQPPLSARQLLLLNLVTDTAPSIAIALRSPPSVTPEELLREGPEASLGMPLARDIVWRALVTAGGATAGWLLARPLRSRSTVALAALVGTQLGQVVVTAGRSRSVALSSLGSLVATAVVIQTPGLSHFFGCRPLGPIGLGIAGSVSVVAAGASLLVPRLLPALDPWLEALARSANAVDLGRRAADAAFGLALEPERA